MTRSSVCSLSAALVSFLLKEVSDAIIIAIVIVVNATVGVIQEGKAQKALESLKKLSKPQGGGQKRRCDT